MRISTGYQYDRYSQSLTIAQQKLMDATEQAQSGKRIAKPSDDPSGAAAVVRLSSLKGAIGQYKTNGLSAKASLTTTESTLSDVSEVAKQAYQLAVRGGNGTLSKTDRESLAKEVASLQQRLVDLANTKDPSGGYVFGGTQTESTPFSVTNGQMTFAGNTSVRQAEISADATVTLGAQGQPLITDLYGRMESLRTALNAGTTDTASTQIADMQTSMDAVNLSRADVGTRLDHVTTQASQLQRREDELAISISDKEDVDITEALIHYQSAQTAYQAALNVVSQGFKYSLMDFIRG